MKRTVLLLFAVVLALSLCACGEKDEPDGAQLANPITELGSLEELNKQMGTRLAAPGVMGVTDEAYRVIDCGDYKIAELAFCVNGMAYSLRSASVTNDISGVYLDGEQAFPEEMEDEIEYAYGSAVKLARWFDLSGQYVLCIEDEGKLDRESFAEIAEEMRELTFSGMTESQKAAYYAALEGEYQDSFSQRATLSVEADGSSGATALVIWSGSAAEHAEWTMTLRLGEDGLLSYHDCTARNVAIHEDGTQTEQIVYEGGSGYFSFVDGKLYWNGAAEADCTQCVFEREQ